MHGSSDDILERAPTREVTGVFHSRNTLEAAVQDLLVAGIDRADIDVSASLDKLQRSLNYKSIPAADIADHPAAARQPFVGKDDVVNTDAVAGSIAGCVVAVALAFYLISRGAPQLAVGFFSILGGLVVGGGAVFLVRRRLRREHTLGLDKLSEAQGLVIWLRVRSPEKEAEAQEILARHGGEGVHVHEMELAKRPEDLPLSSLRADPWLGDERLGRP
jgi:hypothetical protein